ncbi:putative ribonuclease H-like domain-containing protein [Tanacetum coccineum]
MSNYIKHIRSYTLQQLKGYSFDEINSLFEATMKRINTFTPMESDVDKTVPKIAARSTKRAAKEELDYLGKFDGKSDEGFFVRYSLNSKAFRVYNIRTRKVEENLHIRFLEDKPIIAYDGPKWLFDIDVLTKSMDYLPVVAGTNSNDSNASNDEPQPSSDARKKDNEGVSQESGIDDQERPKNSTQDVNTAGPSINTASTNVNTSSLIINTVSPTVTTTSLEATHADFFGDEIELDMSNITTIYLAPSTPNTRNHKDHSLDHVIVEPKKVIQALTDPSWIEAMHDELLQFKLQKVWTLVDLPYGNRAIGTKWVYRNKKDKRVARIEAIRLFLAYASFKDFIVYHMDVKSAFLLAILKRKFMSVQPLVFEDLSPWTRVYKVEKALYGLHQAPRAYALTVNPTIYTSCIKQLWATAKAKTINGEVQIQALVDGKKVIVTETSVRRALQLKDAEGTECLPNATIFAELERMGAKTTVWNEFSSTMASAIICLATNQKFNFSKYIFDNMMKNFEGGVIFLMYLRGRKGFSERVTLLFQTMMVQAPEELGEGSEIPTDPQHTLTIIQPSTSQPQKKQPRRQQRKDTKVSQPSGSTEPITDEATNEEHLPIHSNDLLLSSEDRLKLNELMELCTNLSQRVLDLENTKTFQAAEIAKLKKMVKKLERTNKSRTPSLKRLRKVGRSAQVFSSEDEGLGAQEDASKQGRKIADIDADAKHEVEIDKAVSTDEVTSASVTPTTVDELTLAKTLIEIKAAKPKAITTAATTTTTAVSRPKARGVVVQEPSEFTTTTSQLSQLSQAKDKGKGKWIILKLTKDKGKAIMEEAETIQTKIKLQLEQERFGYEEALRLQAEIDEEERQRIAIVQEENLFETTMRRVHTFVPMKSESERVIPELAAGSSKRDAEEELVQESSKRLKTRESSVPAEEPKDKEEEELSQERIQQMMIIVPEQGMNVEALQTKEDLVKKKKLVSHSKEKFTSTEPTEDKERELWVELKRLFEPDTDDELWKLQKHIHDVTWRLYDTCGVHHVSTKDGVDIYMLVEREYPLSRGVLTQMLVAKLLVEQDSEMSRELLRKIFMQV